jgi:hypothetical protein
VLARISGTALDTDANLDSLTPDFEKLALLILGTGQTVRQFSAAVQGPNAQIPKDPAEDDEADKIGHHCALLLSYMPNNNVRNWLPTAVVRRTKRREHHGPHRAALCNPFSQECLRSAQVSDVRPRHPGCDRAVKQSGL